MGDKSIYAKLHSDFGDIEILHAEYIRQNFSRHSHDGYGMGVITDGALEFYYRGENLIAGKGYVNTVNPDEIHDGHSYGEDGWRYSMLYFKEDVFRNIFNGVTDRYDTPYITSGVIKDIHLAHSISRLVTDVINGGDRLETDSRLMGLLSAAVIRHSDKRPSDIRTYRLGGKLSKVKEYINDNIEKKMTLNELAELAGLSQYHFARSFKSDCGLAPYEYVSVKRAERAKNMLFSGVKPVDASAECGYTDQSHMNRFLKKYYGITPSDFVNI